MNTECLKCKKARHPFGWYIFQVPSYSTLNTGCVLKYVALKFKYHYPSFYFILKITCISFLQWFDFRSLAYHLYMDNFPI